jgi:hypothetical protein
MSLTSYRAAPPRVGDVLYSDAGVSVEAPVGLVCRIVRAAVQAGGSPAGFPGCIIGLRLYDLFLGRCCMDWKTWRRPTLPCLETQYHGRWGFSRPSSGRDRVRAPRQSHQVVQSIQRLSVITAVVSYHSGCQLSQRLSVFSRRFSDGRAIADILAPVSGRALRRLNGGFWRVCGCLR